MHQETSSSSADTKLNFDSIYCHGGTTYFYPTSGNSTSEPQQPPAAPEAPATAIDGAHTFVPSAHALNIAPKNPLFSAFLSIGDLKKQIYARNEELNSMAGAENVLELDNYHTLCPIETDVGKMPQIASTYKATNGTDGMRYCLRRLHNCRLQSTKCMQVVDKWRKLQHSNIVKLKEVFTSKAFGDNSLILVYDYHPCSETLLSRYFKNGETFPEPRYNKSKNLLPENELWWIIMQISAAVRAVHQSGLACRTLDPTKIIITAKRLRLSFLGISDIVLFDPNESFNVINHYQQEDLTSLGKLMLALACKSLQSIQRERIQTSIDMISRIYSADLRHLIIYLLTTNTERSITEIMPMIGARFYVQLDALQSQVDILEEELSKEVENSRLYRLMVKMASINERPEFNLDLSWSETGDRYMLKLFRDYLFHAVTPEGKPWLSNAHIVQNLNKLDAGSPEKVQLVSRDEQSVLVVTYAELKNCLDRAFQELLDASY